MLNFNFEITKDDKGVSLYIGEESGSGAEYEMSTMDDIGTIVNNYVINYYYEELEKMGLSDDENGDERIESIKGVINKVFDQTENDISKYNIGDIVDKLYQKFDKNLVNAAMVDYLRGQYLV